MGLAVKGFNDNGWRRRHARAVDNLIELYYAPDSELRLSDIATHLILLANALRHIDDKIKNI